MIFVQWRQVLPGGREPEVTPSGTCDLYLAEDTEVRQDAHVKLPLGIVLALPRGWLGMIFSKNRDAFLDIMPGVVHWDRRGEEDALFVRARYVGPEQTALLRKGVAVAQLAVVPLPAMVFDRVEELPLTKK